MNRKVLLGSNSPRRQELLSGMGIPYEVVHIDCDEHYPSDLSGEDIPKYIAKEKADAYREQLHDNELLITADTIVWVDNEMLGKPHDKQDAMRMLKKLSSNTHQVFTAVCLTTNQAQQVLADRTDVTFCSLSETEIEQYVNQYMPLDKAGAYGVQEWIGYVGVQKIVGSFYNVMGLPIHLLYQALQQLN